MEAVFAYLSLHPELLTSFLWPTVTAIFVLLFKRRTPEAYEKLARKHPVWFFARLAAFWQLLGAIGVDPIKATEATKKIISGKINPK